MKNEAEETMKNETAETMKNEKDRMVKTDDLITIDTNNDKIIAILKNVLFVFENAADDDLLESIVDIHTLVSVALEYAKTNDGLFNGIW